MHSSWATRGGADLRRLKPSGTTGAMYLSYMKCEIGRASCSTELHEVCPPPSSNLDPVTCKNYTTQGGGGRS